ncbi:hypothetical protein [Streptomyces sp. NPDC057729]|uniref:hypothetical protein n=1 Tax=Streptomyces sp. NPDC057729 TaxID=3346230 RepID=UPI00368A3E7E
MRDAGCGQAADVPGVLGLPEPDGYAGQRPYWTEETVAAWDASRPSTVRADVEDGHRRCSKCDEVKPDGEFYT